MPERGPVRFKRRDERYGTDQREEKPHDPLRLERLLLRRSTVRPAGLDLPAEIAHRNARSDQPHPSARDESEQVLAGLVHMINR